MKKTTRRPKIEIEIEKITNQRGTSEKKKVKFSQENKKSWKEPHKTTRAYLRRLQARTLREGCRTEIRTKRQAYVLRYYYKNTREAKKRIDKNKKQKTSRKRRGRLYVVCTYDYVFTPQYGTTEEYTAVHQYILGQEYAYAILCGVVNGCMWRTHTHFRVYDKYVVSTTHTQCMYETASAQQKQYHMITDRVTIINIQ